jgi:hypothetical protein
MTKTFLTAIIGLLLITSAQNATGQIFTGGNIGFNFDNNGSVFDASPIVGYRINKLEAGLAPFLTYTMPNEGDNQYLFGNRVFSKYHIAKGLFLHAEFEAVNYPVPELETREWSMGLPLGAGYEQKIGVVRVHASILYDLLLDETTGKKNPIYRGGIVYDF